MKDRLSAAFVLFVCALWVSACSPEPLMGTMTPTQVSESRELALTPYHTRTATITPTGTNPATRTPFPTPTATPRTHEVKQGEDMFGIAFLYGITIDELKAANPEVNPNLMSVGTTLVIPASAQADETQGTQLTPPAAEVEFGEVRCFSSVEGGLWCVASVRNSGDEPLESVTAQVRLADENGLQVAVRTALTPLNILLAGEEQPLIIFFPPPVPPIAQANIELLTAFPVQAVEERYVPARIVDPSIEIAPDGQSAQVTGEVRLEKSVPIPSLVWVSAIAYDQKGQIAGVRRWEYQGSIPFNQPLPFNLSIYSLKEPIVRIELAVEARP